MLKVRVSPKKKLAAEASFPLFVSRWSQKFFFSNDEKMKNLLQEKKKSSCPFANKTGRPFTATQAKRQAKRSGVILRKLGKLILKVRVKI